MYRTYNPYQTIHQTRRIVTKNFHVCPLIHIFIRGNCRLNGIFWYVFKCTYAVGHRLFVYYLTRLDLDRWWQRFLIGDVVVESGDVCFGGHGIIAVGDIAGGLVCIAV